MRGSVYKNLGVPNTPSWILPFTLKLDASRVKSGGAFSWVKIDKIWRESDATIVSLQSFIFLDLKPTVNSLGPNCRSQPIKMAQFQGLFGLGP